MLSIHYLKFEPLILTLIILILLIRYILKFLYNKKIFNILTKLETAETTNDIKEIEHLFKKIKPTTRHHRLITNLIKISKLQIEQQKLYEYIQRHQLVKRK